MSRKNDITTESSIRYHETNLAQLIQEKNDALKKVENNESISPYYLKKLDGVIAQAENIIHNLRTKGHGYD